MEIAFLGNAIDSVTCLTLTDDKKQNRFNEFISSMKYKL